MVACKHIGKFSVIIIECMVLRYGILVAKSKGLLDLEVEGDSKIIVDCYIKKINIHSFILLLIDDIWNISQDLNIYIYRHV